MTQIFAYINFAGNATEAMNFYKDCLGADLVIQKVGGSPVEAYCPASMKDQVMHSALTKGPLLLMASDMQGPGGFTGGNTVALSLNCSSEEEINTFFTRLSAGGTIVDTLGVKFWGAIFGVLVDKFGIRWMLNYDKAST